MPAIDIAAAVLVVIGTVVWLTWTLAVDRRGAGDLVIEGERRRRASRAGS